MGHTHTHIDRGVYRVAQQLKNVCEPYQEIPSDYKICDKTTVHKDDLKSHIEKKHT